MTTESDFDITISAENILIYGKFNINVETSPQTFHIILRGAWNEPSFNHEGFSHDTKNIFIGAQGSLEVTAARTSRPWGTLLQDVLIGDSQILTDLQLTGEDLFLSSSEFGNSSSSSGVLYKVVIE